MKAKHIILSTLFLLAVIAGCKKEVIPTPEPTLSQLLQGVWELDSIRTFTSTPTGPMFTHTSVYMPKRNYIFIGDSVYVTNSGSMKRKFKAFRGSDGNDSVFVAPFLGYQIKSILQDSAVWLYKTDWLSLHRI